MEPHSALNNLDYIVIGIVLISGFLALMRGFVRELFSLLGWTGAYYAAIKFYPVAVPWVGHYLKTDKTAEWGAMAVVFIIALLLFAIAGALASGLVQGRALTTIDRSLGFLYGLLRGALVVSLVYLGAVMILWPELDKTSIPAQTEAQAPEKSGEQTDSAPKKEQTAVPDLLLKARTRPWLAAGAAKLKVFIPKDIVGKTLSGWESHKKEEPKPADNRTPSAPDGQSGSLSPDVVGKLLQGANP